MHKPFAHGRVVMMVGAVLVAMGAALPAPNQSAAEPATPRGPLTHGMAMHGAPAYPPNFPHLSYVNPDAPKGGRLVLGALGSFDSVNPFIVRGQPVVGVRGYVYESLMARALDEPFTLYGLIAEAVEMPVDRTFIRFVLREAARFSDGQPITADDVIFSLELLRDRGRPNTRSYYVKVRRIERVSDREVVFHLDGDDREMPLILGLMPILPRHAITPEQFEQTSLTPPMGSGPYRLSAIEPGTRVVYERDPNYWGRDLAINRGRNNFDTIVHEYFREANALFEAFKVGQIDMRGETDPSRWQQNYDFPAVADGRVRRYAIPLGIPSGMAGLTFNTRRDVFKDARVREALTYLFDFEWLNANVFFGLYRRTESFFDRSELSSHGTPASERERALLAPFADAVRADVMTGSFSQPKTDGSGRTRENTRRALALLQQAGYRLDGTTLINQTTGAPLSFEILATSREQERLFLSFARNLAAIGITANIRQVDSAQYQRRRQTFDFDMIEANWPSSLSPGNEQTFRWGSEAAKSDGSFNFAGVASPAVDAMIAAILAAENRADFVDAVRALDRVLLSGHYVIPLYHPAEQWLAAWSHLAGPERHGLFGYQVDTWWQTAPREANRASND